MQVNHPRTLPPAIVLGGHTSALGVVRAIGEMGVPVVTLHYDARDTAHVSKFCSHSIPAPHPERAEQGFVDLLLACSREFGGGVLFPVSDETVVAVARNKRVLEKHYSVACPAWDVARQFIDKKVTAELAQASNVPAPRTLVPTSADEALEYAERIGFPCLVKPCASHLFYEHFRQKMFPVADREQLVSTYSLAASAGFEVMLQEIIPGDDAHVVNYNAYFHEGKPVLEFTAEHVRNAPPRWGSPRVAVSKDVPEVLDSGRRILRDMGFEGYACTEFKRDARDGLYKLLEVNGRHNLSTLLAVRCGINFPWIHYNHVACGTLPTLPLVPKRGVYWIDLTRDAAYSAGYVWQERYSVREYLRPYYRPHVFAILDWQDLRPLVQRCRFLAREALCGAATRLGFRGHGRDQGTPRPGQPVVPVSLACRSAHAGSAARDN